MNNIIQLKPTVRRTIPVHRITTSLMPQNVQENLMQAAIAVGFFLSDCEFKLLENVSQQTEGVFENLEKAVNVASQYTVLSEIEVDEPVR